MKEQEAVTDAIKRCFRSFGNQFGNSLYDKTKNHQNQDSSYQQNQTQNYNQKPPQNNQQQQAYQNSNNRNNANVNIHHQSRPTTPQNQSFDQYEYQSLFNLGLNIVENNGFLIVTGDDIFSKKDSIKACGFRFDSASKTWYKPVEQGVA